MKNSNSGFADSKVDFPSKQNSSSFYQVVVDEMEGNMLHGNDLELKTAQKI